MAEWEATHPQRLCDESPTCNQVLCSFNMAMSQRLVYRLFTISIRDIHQCTVLNK